MRSGPARDFQALYDAVPEKDVSGAPPRRTFYGPVPRTASEMYAHVLHVNAYYFGEIGVDADNDGTILGLPAARFAALEALPGYLENRICHGSYGEDWTLSKLLAPLCLARPHPRKGPVAHGGQDLWRFCGAGCVWLWPGAGWGNDGWRIGWNVYGGASRAEAAGARRARADERGRRAASPCGPGSRRRSPCCRGAGVVADIGCDHGQLCCALLQRDAEARCVASDVSAPSLQKARELAQAVGLVERISFRCGDGLSVLEAGEAEAVALLGMGGR